MNKKKNKKKLLVLIIVSFFLFGYSVIHQISAQNTTVRVGFFPLDGFHEYDENGAPSGYDVEYLNKIADYTGWEYEYVFAESWVDALILLENEKIDILAPSQITEDRLDRFLLSAYSIGTEYGSLLTWNANDDLSYEGYDKFSEIKIGCVENFVMKEDFFWYAEKNGFTPDIIYYRDTNELLSALRSHQVDAVVANLNLAANNNWKVLAKFAPSPYYYMMPQSNVELMDTLNSALDRLKAENPEFENQLVEQYFSFYKDLPYTSAEQQYLDGAPAFRIGYMSGNYPLTYQDDDGNPLGILIAITNLISETSGLQFEYIPMAGDSITYDDLRANDLDMVLGVEYTANNITAPGMSLTVPFFSSQKVLVSRKGFKFFSSADFTIAISTGSQTLAETLLQKYPNFNIINLPSTKDCLEAVYDGTADIMLQTRYAVEELLMKPKYETLTIIPEHGLEEDLSIGILLYKPGVMIPDQLLSDKRLVSILNKTIQRLDQSILNTILISYTTAVPYKAEFDDFLYRYRTALFIIILFVFIAILISALALRLHSKNVRLIKENEKELRCITNNINGGVLALMPQKGFLIQFANGGFLKMIGAGEDFTEIIKSYSYVTYVHSEDIEKLNSLAYDNMSDGEEVQLELRIRKLTGEYIPVIFKGTISKTKKNVIFYCVVMDITEQKRVLEELQIEKERYTMVIEQTDDIIFDANTEKNYVLLTNKFEEVFGWKAGRVCFDDLKSDVRIYPEDMPIYLEMMRELQDISNTTIISRFRMQKKDQKYIWCDVSMRTVVVNRKLVRIVGKITDVDRQVKEYEYLEQMSTTDSLTGLLNKDAFRINVENYLSSGAARDCALMFMDLDNFKTLNDTLGHMVGDQALKDTADQIRANFRGEDIIGRFGGDEFFIFSRNIPFHVFYKKLDTLRLSIQKTYGSEAEGNAVTISSSIGFVYSETGNISYEELVSQADMALYSAKERGKNRCVMYYENLVLNGYQNQRNI